MSPSALKTMTLVSALFAALFAAQLGLIYGKPEGWLRDDAGRPVAKDFVNFYSAGRLVAEGKPALPYDWDAHRQAQRDVIGDHNTLFFPWPYPPPFLGVAHALTALPYTASFLVFIGLTFAMAATVLIRITGERWAGVWLAGFASTLWNFYAGQNGLLSATLAGAGLLLLRSNPIGAGVAFGLLSFKPQLGLLVPLALAAAGYWRAFAAAAITVLVMVLLSLVTYGLEPWSAFADQLGRISNAGLVETYGKAYKFQSMFGLMRATGVEPSLAMNVHLLFALAVAGAVTLLWRSETALDLKCAGLATAMLAMSPYVYIYDMALLAVAAAFLIRHHMALERPSDATRNLMIGILGVNVLVYAFPFVTVPTGFMAAALMGALIAIAIREGTEPILSSNAAT